MQLVTKRNWWEDRGVALAAVLAMAIPLLWPSIPPLLDLPGHMGRYAVSLSGHHAPDVSQFYDYHWALMGNLGVDLLVWPLSHAIGVEAATKLIVLLIPVTMAAGFLWTAREVHGRIPTTSLLALVFVYAYPLHYGFINYVFGMALVALAFPLWIRVRGRAGIRISVLFGVIAGVVWVSHAIAWVALCTLCGSYELQRQLSAGEPLRRALTGTFWKVLPLATGVVLTFLAASGPPGSVGQILDVPAISKAIISLNRDRWITVDFATSLALAVIISLAMLRRAGLSIAPALGGPALTLLALFFIIPNSVNESFFLKMRILPWGVAYAILAIRCQSVERVGQWAVICVAFLSLRLAATTASLLMYDQSFASTLRALNHVPMGSRIATFTVSSCHPALSGWMNSRRQHLGGIAIVRRGAFVNDQFEAGGLQLSKDHYPAAEPFRHAPSEVVVLGNCNGYTPQFDVSLARLPHQAFDFVWLLDVPRDAWPRRSWLHPVYQDGSTILYSVDHGAFDMTKRSDLGSTSSNRQTESSPTS